MDRTRSFATSLVELAGLSAVSAGIWLIFMPAGLIAVGVSLVLIGVLAA